MFFAGIGIPVMAALNGGLGIRLQNPVLAASILFFVGLMLSLSVLLVTSGVPKTLSAADTPWYFYAGGAFVIFYILSITAIAPHFGVGNAVSFVLLGQLVAMSLIDHFGLLGAPRFEISAQRVIGLVLMASGVFLVIRRS
jgi:transporter family-2 protein